MPGNNLPLFEELSPSLDVMEVVRAFEHWPNLLVLESALQRQPVGRYTFLTADPVAVWQLASPIYGFEPFANIQAEWNQYRCEAVPGLPPFQGGIAGMLGYELGQCWEEIPSAKYDEFKLPVMAVGLYDWVIAWDHLEDRVWLISQGWPAAGTEARRERAAARIKSVKGMLHSEDVFESSPSTQPGTRLDLRSELFKLTEAETLEFAPQYPLVGQAGVTSTFTREDYLATVDQVIDYIYAGDIFQANLSQRLLTHAKGSAVDLYSRLRRVNPAPFAALMLWNDWAIISASPERFLSVIDGEVETRPIKGTRRRKQGPEADLFTRDELRQSEKDQAENVMIVDLLRNDLSRVCQPGSVHVPDLCTVETYETVQHLVSEVRGQLQPHFSVWDLFKATFPGGSITGAPKVRAMEIIAELEPTVRGPYCGSLFYVSADGRTDSNLLIRSFVQRHGWLQCNVGGGIVAQSESASEYEETLTKAAGMLKALVATAE